jgi:formate dehydrogenase major subunit
LIHQIGLPFHWAFAGESVGSNANDLTALLADPNVSMHESKAFACESARATSGYWLIRTRRMYRLQGL